MPLHPSYSRAVVVHANYAQFAPGQLMQNGPVSSRMLLWCRAGTGTVIVNKQRMPVDGGRLLVLPWGHISRYEASQDDPFLLAGIHLIPRHETRRPVQFEVPHTASHPLASVAWRRATRLAGIA